MNGRFDFSSVPLKKLSTLKNEKSSKKDNRHLTKNDMEVKNNAQTKQAPKAGIAFEIQDFHFNRTPRRDRDQSHSGGHAASCTEQGQTAGKIHGMQVKPEADRTGKGALFK